MRTTLAAALALVMALAAAPLVSGKGTAYSSLVVLAASHDDERLEESRLPGSREDGRGAVGEEDAPLVAATSPRRASAWTRLFALLLPPLHAGVPQLKASFAGPRAVRPRSAVLAPRETEEGVRRGLADMLALMSAGAAARR